MIHDFKPYPAYKYSGVPWLGDMPEHWVIQRLDRLFTVRSEQPLEGDQRITGYLDGRVTLRSNVAGQRIKGVVKEAGWQRVHPGDFAISGMNAHLGGMGISDSLGKCSPIYLVLKPKVGTNAYFVSHVVRYAAQAGALKSLVNTIRFNSADFKRGDLKQIQIWLPTKAEQSAIARFIDHVDRRIRRYIRAKKKLIALLNEQKQAIIYRAVTRGLDPNVRLEPSGVEWLGDVPEHWEVRRAKQLFQEVDSRSTTGTEELLSLRMYRGLVPHNEVSQVPINPSNLVGFKRVVPRQIVMNRMRAAIGMFGVVTQHGLVSPDYAVLEPGRMVDAEYYLQLFKTRAAGAVFRLESKGLGTGSSGFMRLYSDRFGMIKLPVPPLEEQRSIVREISNETAGLTETAERIGRELDLLVEFRTRLIADVITGRLDVREAAVRLPEEAEEPEPLDEGEAVGEDDEDDSSVIGATSLEVEA